MYSKKINQLATNLNPQETDLLPIGDAETGQLKTTTFGSVSGITGDGVISGGIVTWTGTGLIFNISACTYILNGIRYSSPFSTKTLAAADPTNARIDVFAVNTSGQVEVIQGTPASNPVEPEGDTTTTLGLTNVTINAGATTPNNVTRDLIYDENVETWTKTFTQSSASVDYANTTSPNTGTKCILVTMGAGFVYLNFSKAVALDISNYKSLSFAIRLNSALTSNTILAVRFQNGSNNVSNLFQINSSNNVGFNRNLAGVYQVITIPFNNTNLKFTNNAFTTIRISTQNAAATYRLDTIQLNGGINNPTGGGTTPSNSFGFVNGSTGTASSTTATDTLNVVGSGLITTSATGKTLTIASNQIATSSILGRVTAGTGNIETLTGTQATTLLDVFTSSLKGLAPASGGGTTNFLRADGTWAAPTGGGGMSIGGSITSATAGSVLFAGTSGVLQQDNANFFWDDTNNRLGIGTTTPENDLHINRSFNGITIAQVSNLNNPTGVLSGARFHAITTGSSLNNNLYLGITSSAATAYKFINPADAYIYKTNSSEPHGHIVILNDNNNGAIKFGGGAVSTEQMTLTALGRLLVNTTTEGTYRLDVNGNGRFSSSLNVGGELRIDVTSAATTRESIIKAFVSDNSTDMFGVANGTSTDARFIPTFFNYSQGTYGGLVFRGLMSSAADSGTGALLSFQTFITTSSSDPNNGTFTAPAVRPLFAFNGGNTTYMQMFANGNIGLNTTTDIASAQLHITSTTKGFLPPKMTTTQKNAISSPAAGLIVYDTTDNKHYGYNGTTWNAFF